MAKSVPALVEPALLEWARRTAGLSLESAAARLKIPPDLLAAWEVGSERPSVPKARLLAKLYKRPLAVFYLPEPPRDFQPLKDYRRLALEARGPSPLVLFAERRSLVRREAALELYPELEGDPPEFDLFAQINEDAEEVGYRLREWLGVSLDVQRSWLGTRAAYNAWRAAIERRGVLVFQASGVPMEEMRGFSIGEFPLPAITVNSRDAYAGRTFTLLHELSHLALRQAGLCDLVVSARRMPWEQTVEIFCNATAAAALMPRHIFLADPLIASGERREWPDEILIELAAHFGTSRDAVLRRLLSLGLTTKEYYRRRHRAWLEERKNAKKKKGGNVPAPVKVLASSGRLFTRLVLDGLHQRVITGNSASEYLNAKVSDFAGVERLLLRKGR